MVRVLCVKGVLGFKGLGLRVSADLGLMGLGLIGSKV